MAIFCILAAVLRQIQFKKPKTSIMKRFILFTFSILLTFSFATAQDGINYQGAATDANGDELTNQSISIRASVLSGSASGNLEWEETHSATTDQFGLFNIVIGQGTNTTNGATASFDDMDWGSGNHFLKIEMDATGGTNYAMIGTTQMMSVPYALYAKSAGIDSAAIAAMIGSSGGGMGGGCDYKFPEGLDGEAISLEFHSTSSQYTVPIGKTLYITNLYAQGPGIDVLDDNGNWLQLALNVGQGPVYASLESPIVLNEGRTIKKGSHGYALNGILINATGEITSVVYNLAGANNNEYQVPTGKKLYITHVTGGQNTFLTSSGTPITTTGNIGQPIILNSSESINGFSNFNGYLVDENYFANCGGGGSSSSASAVDSAMVAGMIANAGGTIGSGSLDIDTIYYNLDQASSGFFGAHYFDTLDITQDGFLFARSHVITASQSYNQSSCVFIIHYGYNLEEDARLVGQETSNSRMFPVKNGMKMCLYSVLNNDSDLDLFFIPASATADGLSNNSGSGGSGFNWRFPDGLTGTPLTWHLPGNDYTVPAGKNLYVTSFAGKSTGEYMRIDGLEIINDNDFEQIIIVGPGSVVSTNSNTSSNWANFNGYLVDENYFAGFGGGGSSSSASNATIDSLSQVVSNLDSLMGIITPFFGCTDPTACNYDANAVIDNGNCSGLLGCTDNQSSNYNASATCDDGSCLPYIGMYAYGGVVFYIGGVNNSSIHVLDINDQIASTKDGAASLCVNLSTNGYTDWSLPTWGVMYNDICPNYTILNNACIANGGDPLNNTYWVSGNGQGTWNGQPNGIRVHIDANNCSQSNAPPNELWPSRATRTITLN